MENSTKDFQVEMLEQRLEMAEWKPTSEAACTSGDCRGTVGLKVTL
ncbi:hypothetical protein [Salegentibacter sp. Hel_I_6]|nr:hypothetical protein [Salegentibacter sp. Hel_I_6]